MQDNFLLDWDRPGDDFYNQTDFDEAFIADVKAAQRSVVIVSGWAKLNRITNLGDTLLGLPARGVKVCAFIQMPRFWGKAVGISAIEAANNRNLETVIDLLESHGIHVTLVKRIHQKICIIDGCILWLGSMNILSHFDTEEEMLRLVDPVASLAAIKRNRLICPQCIEARKPLPASVSLGDVLQDLGMRLTEMREQAGYDQTRLSKITGISRWRIGRIERNEIEPSLREGYALFTALGRNVGLLAPGVTEYFEEIDLVWFEANTRTRAAKIVSGIRSSGGSA